MFEVIANTSTLSRSGMGSITGQIFLQSEWGSFPGAGWSDFPVAVLAWWIEGLNNLVNGKTHSFQGLFMDGPFTFVVERVEETAGRISWGRRDEETPIGMVDIGAMLRSAVRTGRAVADSCRNRNWSGRDLEQLEQAIAQAAPKTLSLPDAPAAPLMRARVYSVGLVVDRAFGERLFDLASRLHVWIVDSPTNRLAVEQVWQCHSRQYSLEKGATIFRDDGSVSPDVVASRVLGDIELHHGQYSHDPPLSRLEIYGASGTEALSTALQEFGFVLFEDLPEGFMASREVDAELQA
jgi:hypothetical protein